ncbi:MAG: hypothetical protein ACTH2X_15170 [Brachybacterium tyrofermentans]
MIPLPDADSFDLPGARQIREVDPALAIPALTVLGTLVLIWAVRRVFSRGRLGRIVAVGAYLAVALGVTAPTLTWWESLAAHVGPVLATFPIAGLVPLPAIAGVHLIRGFLEVRNNR